MPDGKADLDLSAEAKLDAIAVVETYIHDEIPFADALYKARKLSRVKWYRRLLEDFGASYDPECPEMPYAPKDSTRHPLVAEAAAKRVVLFLKSGRHYDDGEATWVRWLNRCIVTVFLISFPGVILALILQEGFKVELNLEPVIKGFIIALVLAFAPLFALYFVGLGFAAVHIFRVRVLRQDLRSKLEGDIWPYLERADYEADLAAFIDQA